MGFWSRNEELISENKLGQLWNIISLWPDSRDPHYTNSGKDHHFQNLLEGHKQFGLNFCTQSIDNSQDSKSGYIVGVSEPLGIETYTNTKK